VGSGYKVEIFKADTLFKERRSEGQISHEAIKADRIPTVVNQESEIWPSDPLPVSVGLNSLM